MKKLLSLAVALAAVVAVAYAAELKSGLQSGDAIGAFDVTKVAGATDDGVEVGKTLCYRCKYGSRPMVMVFTRQTDEKMADLIKQLDSAVAKNSDTQLRAFVNVLGDDRADAEKAAEQLASATKPANVPVVVPVEFKNGPDNYGINPQADVTIILATDGKVTGNHTFEKGLSCESCVESIMTDVSKLTSK
ncbi:MAG TPA: hypothetical protein VHZ24_09015 [Pirellulales bacterium]|jgi:hypothetical protein|nr:hypothetical protein [Pirellulales bacterium]